MKTKKMTGGGWTLAERIEVVGGSASAASEWDRCGREELFASSTEATPVAYVNLTEFDGEFCLISGRGDVERITSRQWREVLRA